jgi:outer membrane protein OmpA-like peptidoglycan-associated protein
MVKKTMAASLTIVSLIASIAMAQDESQTSKMAAPKPTYMNVNDPVGWFPFIGLAGGYMSPDDTLLTEGVPGDLKLLGSYFSEGRHSVFDFGLGFMANSFTQKSEVQDNFISGGIAEMAWRYNSTNRWQIGPIVDAYIGGGDRMGSTDPTWTSFAGLQLLKEFPVKGSNMFRVGIKALTDLSIPDAAINTVSLDLQWGFGSEQKAPEISEADTTSSDVASATTASDDSMRSDLTGQEAAAAAAGATIANSRRVIETDPANNAVTFRNDARMQFDTGRASFQGSNEDFVRRVGETLKDRSDLFDKVEVIGFADQTGGRAINMKVSKERAQEVAKTLEDAGLPSNKIQTSWKGAENPLYKSLLPEDMQQNRRVDLKFHGVKDQTALQDVLNGL